MSRSEWDKPPKAMRLRAAEEERDAAREHVALLEEEAKLSRPTVSQVMEALGAVGMAGRYTTAIRSWSLRHVADKTVEEVTSALVAIGAARPDPSSQEETP